MGLEFKTAALKPVDPRVVPTLNPCIIKFNLFDRMTLIQIKRKRKKMQLVLIIILQRIEQNFVELKLS